MKPIAREGHLDLTASSFKRKKILWLNISDFKVLSTAHLFLFHYRASTKTR